VKHESGNGSFSLRIVGVIRRILFRWFVPVQRQAQHLTCRRIVNDVSIAQVMVYPASTTDTTWFTSGATEMTSAPTRSVGSAEENVCSRYRFFMPHFQRKNFHQALVLN